MANERQASHTPGPWGLSNDEGSERYEIGINADVGVKIICSVDYGFYEPFESQQHANARLIAAAPDLLAALKAMDESLCNGFDTQAARHAGRMALIATRAAIAKAEGRS